MPNRHEIMTQHFQSSASSYQEIGSVPLSVRAGDSVARDIQDYQNRHFMVLLFIQYCLSTCQALRQ